MSFCNLFDFVLPIDYLDSDQIQRITAYSPIDQNLFENVKLTHKRNKYSCMYITIVSLTLKDLIVFAKEQITKYSLNAYVSAGCPAKKISVSIY